MMDNQKENIITHSMRAGLTLGIVTSILNVLGWLQPADAVVLPTLLSFMTIFATFFCVFHYTSRYNVEVLDNSINYFQAFRYGIYMFFFTGAILAVTTYVFYTLNGEVLDRAIEQAESIVKREEDKQIFTMLKSLTAKDYAMSLLVGYPFMGAIICLGTSFMFTFKNKLKKN